MRCSKHAVFFIFLKQRVLVTYIDAAAVQAFSRSVVYVIVRASCIVAGPCKVIDSVSLYYNRRLAEVCHTVDLTDRSFLDAHHVVVKLCDSRRSVSEQDVGCAVIVCKDRRIDRLSHIHPCVSAHGNCHKSLALVRIRTCRVVCYRNTDSGFTV